MVTAATPRQRQMYKRNVARKCSVLDLALTLATMHHRLTAHPQSPAEEKGKKERRPELIVLPGCKRQSVAPIPPAKCCCFARAQECCSTRWTLGARHRVRPASSLVISSLHVLFFPSSFFFFFFLPVISSVNFFFHLLFLLLLLLTCNIFSSLIPPTPFFLFFF